MKRVLKYTVEIIILFYAIQACFWALNQKSSIANVGGFLGVVTIVTFVIMKVIDFIKEQLKNEEE